MKNLDSYADPDLLYLNSGNLSLCPKQILDAVQRYQKEFEKNPTEGLSQAWGQLWQAQKALARFLHADPKDLFLRPNVTSVLNTFILGTRLKRGNEILVGELEYGSIVNICRFSAARSHRNLRVLKMPQSAIAFEKLTKDSLLEAILSQLNENTGMLVLSHVVAGTGLVIPIEEIARETRQKEILFVVDGAYAPGALPIDFNTLSDVDFYGCSLYKWMLGPKGTAFGWVNPIHQATLEPNSAGWTTFDTHGPFAAFGEGHPFQDRFLLSGCQDFAPFRALKDLVDLWDSLDPKRIQKEMRQLQEFLLQEVQNELGWRCLRAQEESLHGPLLTFKIPDSWQNSGPTLASQILQELRIQINTVCLRGSWHVIFSPHAYNTEEEIRQAVARLKRFNPS